MLPDIQHQTPDKPVVFGALGDALPDLAYGDGEWLPQLKYSDDQPRDDHGRWTDDGGNIGGGKPGGTTHDGTMSPPILTVYHGTAKEYIDSIKRDGLVLHPPLRNFGEEYYKGDRGESVFVTNERDNAVRWAYRAAIHGEQGKDKEYTPVVLKINLPLSVASLLKPDTFIPGADYLPVSIKPEWIEKYETLKENYVTLYLAMVIAEPAKKNVKYSDDQPRDDHGRWTDSGGGETINEPTWSGYSDSKAQSDGIYIRTETEAAPPNSRSVEEIGDLLDAKGPPLPYLETKDMTDEERAQVRANVARATDEMEADVRFQLDQTKNGLDWYEQDVKTAFEITAEHIPSLQDEKQQQLFSVVAGIMSTQTEPGQDWDQSARVFEKYKETGEFPIRNPENDRQWGFPSKEAGLSMLNNMIAATSEKETIDWLMQEHTGREINLAHQIYGGGGAASKLTMNEKAPGFRVFGPKIGEFIGNINGVSGITVDLWATRSFNRYFNQVNTQRVNNVPVSKGHRDAIKTMMTTVADRIGLKPQQAQAAIWFFEQQLYNHLGAKRATPGSFSEGAQKYSSRKKSIFDDQPSTPTRDEVDCMIAWMLRLRSGIPDESADIKLPKFYGNYKYSDDQPRDDHGRWTDAGGGGGSVGEPDKPSGVEMVSPNVSENLTFDQALRALDSERAHEVLNESRQVDKILAIPSEHDPAIGAWSDGAENSIIATITGHTTFDMIEASAAMKGMIADQKAVIPFHVEENGPDSMYRFTTPTGDLHAVHDALEKMGIEYHTLQPEGKGVRVWVFDQGSGIADKVVSAGVKYGQQVEVWHGRGEFLGGDTRDEGRNAYQRVIDRTLGPDQKRQWEGLYRGWRETHPVLHAYAEALTREYDESQHPRDEHGRWTSTGGGGGRPPFELTPDEKPDSSPLHTEFSRRWEPLAPSTLGIEGHFDGTPVSVDKLPESEVEHIQNVIHDMEEQIREKYHERAISRQQYNAADAALSYAGTALERSWDDTQVGLIALGKDGEPKGGATLSLRNVDETKVAHLEYLGSFQRGAGSTLLREAESEAVKHGAQRLNLYATDYAVPFYQAHGYRRIIAGENDLTKRLSTSMKAMPIAEEPIGVLAFPKANEKKALKYSDDQPRDDHGRWTDGGGGGGSVNEPDASQDGWRGSAEQLVPHGFVVADKTPRTEGLKRQTDEEYAAHVALAKAEIERLEKDFGLKIPPGSIVMPPYDPPVFEKDADGKFTGATTTYEKDFDSNKLESTLTIINDKEFADSFATATFGPIKMETRDGFKIPVPSWTIAQREKTTLDQFKTDIFRHELGHALDEMRHTAKWVQQNWFDQNGDLKVPKETMTRVWTAKNISGYAAKAPHEGLAEIFSMVTAKGYVKGTLPIHFEKMVDHMLGKRARS